VSPTLNPSFPVPPPESQDHVTNLIRAMTASAMKLAPELRCAACERGNVGSAWPPGFSLLEHHLLERGQQIAAEARRQEAEECARTAELFSPSTTASEIADAIRGRHAGK
jgi:hypothetical protein